MKYRLLLIISLLFFSCSSEPEKTDKAMRKEIEFYLQKNHQTPQEIIISLFNDHDIVFLGEFGGIKHDVEFVQQIIPLLYENGIYTICTEYARREDQPLIDSLIYAWVYNENLAREICFRNNVFGGYREYVDVFKAVWDWNMELDGEKRKFRILGLNDSPVWSVVKLRRDMDIEMLVAKAMRGQGQHLWAKTIMDDVIEIHDKALIYCSQRNAFTKFPFEDSVRTVGRYVFQEIGERSATVFLHAPVPAGGGYSEMLALPADGIIDELPGSCKPESYPVGFTTDGTPMGRIPLGDNGFGRAVPNSVLSDFCDGWILLKPIEEYEGVTVIEDFITEENLEAARRNAPNPQFRNAPLEKFTNAIKRDADIQRKFKYLREQK